MIKEKVSRLALHLFLAILCFLTILFAGIVWLNKDPSELSNVVLGLPYAISVFAILTAHEFGHYFAARYHSINTTLPFYIPIPPFIFTPWGSLLLNPFGTMGAIIRLRDPLSTRKILFDVGVAGPLAGLVVTMIVFALGFITLPDKAFLNAIHPEYITNPQIPEGGMTFGYSLFFKFAMQSYHGTGFLPPMNEIYHYPYFCAAWFGLLITGLNLIPIGQLDGGHILYALIGKHQGAVSRILLGLLIGLGLSYFIPNTKFYQESAMIGWLVWSAILIFVIKPDHPEIIDDTPLDPNRRLIGWITLGIFIFIFMPVPISGM